ncbi:MAG: hypothetical protein HKN76_00485 [Saprospiraceae bacterium]|nr:hypothetical protein [Saprospiraceae bacterium]
MEESKVPETGCCTRFNPDPWNEKNVDFAGKHFIKDHVTSFFHLPLNFGSVMRRNIKKIEAADAMPKEQIVLSDEKSPWGSDVYIAVTKEVPAAEMVEVPGNFFARVFTGPYQNMRNYINEMKTTLKDRTRKIGKLYFYYPYCPKCAKAYGKNYIVILGQV